MTSDSGRHIRFGSLAVPYILARKKRRTLQIAVLPAGQVQVAAPLELSDERIENALRRKSRWILRQLDYFSENRVSASDHRYVGGETFRYLGRNLRLRVRMGDTPDASLQANRLIITLAQKDSVACQILTDRWFRERARALFIRRLGLWRQRLSHLHLPPTQLAVRAMRSRWGSCSQANRITLNPRLIEVPTSCIDYVIVHELCHLKARRHDAAFFALLDRCLPDWRNRRARLNRAHL